MSLLKEWWVVWFVHMTWRHGSKSWKWRWEYYKLRVGRYGLFEGYAYIQRKQQEFEEKPKIRENF